MITKAEYNYKRLKSTTMGLNVLSLMCFFISAAFTIMLMWDGAATPLKQCLNVIMACCLEIAKVYFFRFLGGEIASKGHENLPGKIALWVLTVFLFVASTFGSIHYYMKTEAEKSGQDKVKDSAYSAMNNDVKSIDSQIEQLLELARKQQEKRYITESKKTLAQVEALRKQKVEAVKNVSGYKAVDTSDSFYGLVSKFFGCEPDAAKGGMYLFLSILLEFCGIASAFYGAFSKAKLMDIELSAMPAGDNLFLQNHGRQHPQAYMVEGEFTIPRSALAPAFAQRESSSHVEKPEIRPDPVKPERKAGFIPTGSGNADLDEIAEKIKADLKQKQATGTGYSNKSSKPDVAVKFSPVPDPVTSTGTSTGPVTGMKLKTKAPVPVPDDEIEDGEDMDIDVVTRDYIAALFPVKVDGSLTGRAQVSKKLFISDDVARLIHQRLKKAGLIRVDGSKTFPECDKDEMLRKAVSL